MRLRPRDLAGAVVVATAVTVTACAPYYGRVGGRDADVPSCVNSDESQFTPFSSGSTTINLGGDVLTLARLGSATVAAGFEASCPSGSQAEWTDDQHAVTILASHHESLPASWTVIVTIERHDQEPPLTTSADNCGYRIDKSSPRGFAGLINCPELRWKNAYESAVDPEAPPLPGMPPFEASLEFEASP